MKPLANRREFLHTTALAAALPVVEWSRSSADASTPRMAVIDRRFEPARRFADAIRRSGFEPRAIDGDVTRLWFDELDPRWRVEPAPLLGLTARGALFCLERLAWDHGMRVVFDDRHASPRMDGAWPERVAEALARMPLDTAPRRGPSEASMPAGAGDDDSVLYSWIIAPVPTAGPPRTVTGGGRT